MKLKFRPIDLHLRHVFTISRSSKRTAECVSVELEHEGISGYGEASPSERYGESRDSVFDFLKKINLSRFADPFQLEGILEYVGKIMPGNTSAKAAVDIALHDWIGKKLDIPYWKMLGLDREKTPLTSFTIGIDSPENIERKIREAESYPILKVKVGIPSDEEIVKTIRKLTDKIIRADANEGWKSREQARDKILWLEEQGVEFIEQPLPAEDIEGTAWLRDFVHIPIIADESVTKLNDIPALREGFDGVNIKLMKCTGIHEALRMIHSARAVNLRVMLGCMIESSIGISAAAQLSPLCDYADLDGNMLITDDPFEGVKVDRGKLILNDLPGIGVRGK